MARYFDTGGGGRRFGGCETERDDRRARLCNFFLATLAAIALTFGLVNLLHFDNTILATAEFVVLLIVLAALADLRRNHDVERAAWVTILSAGGLTLFFYHHVQADFSASVWLVFFAMVNFFLLGTRRAIPTYLAFSGFIVAMVMVNREHWPPLQADATLVNIFGALITSGAAAFYQERSREQAHDKVQQLANRDSLTGISNRRHFIARFRDVQAALEPAKRPYSLLLADIDDFKQINDAYGHATGDEVITVVSQRVTAAVRSDDVVGRLGGEEFGILLLDCDATDAPLRAEAIRQAIAATPVAVGDHRIPVTISIGVAHGHPGMQSFNELFTSADQCLYLAKDRGRNCVITGATLRRGSREAATSPR